MEFYTLNSDFEREVVIDEFESGIWTERYTALGDVKLILPATRERVKQLATGTFLALRGTKEVMLLDTQSIEEGMLTVTGNTLEKVFAERSVLTLFRRGVARFHKLKAPPGQVIGFIVQRMFTLEALPTGVILDHAPVVAVRIRNLKIGALDQSGSDITITFKPGPLYPQLLSIAEAHDLGMSLDFKFINKYSHELTFRTYKGVDHTSDSTINDLVRFSPDLDSLA